MILPPGGEVSILRASENPFAGWVSRGYDRRAPSTTVVWRGRLGAGDVIETVFARMGKGEG
jgi:hypothetical protein